MTGSIRSFPDQLADILLRIGLLERRQAVALVAAVTSGTTTERNDYYTPPTNDVERATLANKRVRWFNTTTGWTESYYAPTGLTGLTAPGLVAGSPAGWYPMGRADTYKVAKTNGFQAIGAAGASLNVNGWTTRDDHGDIALTSDRLVVPRAGRYRVEAKFYLSGGHSSVSAGFNLSGTGPANNSVGLPAIVCVTSTAIDEGFYVSDEVLLPAAAAVAAGAYHVALYSGAITVWGDAANYGLGTTMRLTYEGPPLA